MHFDIVEAMRQKQREQVQSIGIDNGDMIDIDVDDGAIVVRARSRSGPQAQAAENIPQGD